MVESAKRRDRLVPEWIGGSVDDPGMVVEPGWTPEHLKSSLDFFEDDSIRELRGVSPYIALLAAEPLSAKYYAAHTLIAITRIRRASKAGNVDEALCGAVELGKILSEEAAYGDYRWKLGERRLRVRSNAAKATWGSSENRKARKQRIRQLFLDAMNNGAVTQEQAYDAVGREVGVSARTIRRIVTGS